MKKYLLWLAMAICLAVCSGAFAADSTITALTEDVSPTGDDLVVTVNDPAGTPSNRKVKLQNLPSAIDPALGSIAGLTTSADKTIYSTSADTYAVTTLTAFGRSLMDDADAVAGRSTLGLGSIATQAASSVAITGGAIDGAAIGAATPSTVKGSTLETTGNAGIGTAPGTHRLEVRLDGAGFQTIAAFENQQAAAANVGPQIMFEGASNTDMASVQSGWNGAATTDAYLTWSTRSSNAMGERMRLTSAGLLGVGTTPVNKLDVEGGAAIGATYSGASTAPTNGLIVEGNVGIGVAAGVGVPLLVYKDGATLVSTITMQNSTAAASGVGSYFSFAGPSGVIKATIISQYDDASGNETSMMFQNRTAGSTVERMRIKGSNLLLGLTTAGTSSEKVFAQSTGTAPTTSPADAYQQYSSDIVAGNAAPHFRTENGDVVKLFKGAALTAADASAVDGTYSAEEQAVISNLRTRLGELEARLQALGLIP